MDKEQSSRGDGFVLIGLERLELQYLRHEALPVRPDNYVAMQIMSPAC